MFSFGGEKECFNVPTSAVGIGMAVERYRNCAKDGIAVGTATSANNPTKRYCYDCLYIHPYLWIEAALQWPLVGRLLLMFTNTRNTNESSRMFTFTPEFKKYILPAFKREMYK